MATLAFVCLAVTSFATSAPFSKLKYYSLTTPTSYTVRFGIHDDGPNGQYNNGIPQHNYEVTIYLADTNNPSFSNRETMPDNFYITVNVTNTTPTSNSTVTMNNIPILQGQSYHRGTFSNPQGLTFTINSVTLSANWYNGIPIYYDTTTHWY